MANGTTVVCSHCGATQRLGITLQNVSIRGAAMNVAVECANCGQTFEAAPGGDGTYSTIGGRIVRVADALARLSPDELTALQQELLQAKTLDQRERAEEVLEEQVPSLRELWRPQTHEQFWAMVMVIVKMITLLGGAGAAAVKSDDVVDALVEQISEVPTAPDDDADPRDADA